MRKLFLLVAAAAVALTLSFSSGAAFAATAYPPPVTQTVTCGIGQTCVITFSGFAPGTTVAFFVNGISAGPGTNRVADVNGQVTCTVTITDPHVSANGGPPIAVPFGNVIITAVGLAPGGAPITVPATLFIPGGSSTTPTTTVLSSGTSGSSGSSSSSGSGSSGSLAFTGADIAATVVGGLALMGLGLGLVTFTRKRRHSHI
jgi:hypothetical protein